MRKIFGYVKEYAIAVDKRILMLSALFIAIAIFINYQFDLNERIYNNNSLIRFIDWYFIFLITFTFSYILTWIFKFNTLFRNSKFHLLLFIAPALFAWKMAFEVHFPFSSNPSKDSYWNMVAYWPFKLIVISFLIFIMWRIFDKEKPFYGLRTRGFNASPYFMLLLFMVPLVALASTQPDFLHTYPKLKSLSYLSGPHSKNIWYKIIFELSYGSDFFSIELFFRGFLLLAFTKWAGKDAILPMACFYCTIHFGKPLGECISSFFGGLILGAITFNTQTIFGGLIVHLGIAWLMELGGYLGNNVF